MECPKCGFEHEPQATECRRCGVVFAKFAERAEATTPRASDESEVQAQLPSITTGRIEFRNRLVTIPSALVGARLLVSLAPGAVRLLSMWIHEAGHAATAWLCGFTAIPGPWFTPVASTRSHTLTFLLAGLIVFGSLRAWRNRRRGLAIAGAAVLVVQLWCTLKLYSDQAQQLIIFGGDAGCFVLGSLLIITFYVRRQSIIYENKLRWAFVIIGALAFMDAYAVWSGGIETIPFGENENGMSDPSVLTETYGWSLPLLIGRYHRLAVSCLAILGATYIIGVATTFPASNTEIQLLTKAESD